MKTTTKDPAILVKNRKELIEEMSDKFGYLFCIKCKRSSGFYKLHVHHLVYRSEAPNHPHLHSKANLYICCNECHDKFHQNKPIRESILEERGLRELFHGFING